MSERALTRNDFGLKIDEALKLEKFLLRELKRVILWNLSWGIS